MSHPRLLNKLTYTDGFKLDIYENINVINPFLVISKANIKLDINIYNILVSIRDRIIRSLEFKIIYQGNNCGPNAREICIGIPTYITRETSTYITRETSTYITRGILLIHKWKTKIYQDVYKDIFGSDSIGMSYHALAYFLINDYHIAIDTTSNKDKIQFYISANKNDFIDIIKTRFQCDQFSVYSDYEDPNLHIRNHTNIDNVILSSNDYTDLYRDIIKKYYDRITSLF